jgi:hypothetical protein
MRAMFFIFGALGFAVAAITISYTFFRNKHPIKKESATQAQPVRNGTIQVVKVKDCEYVLWDDYSGVAMEHYEGCQNPQHCN